MQEYTTMVKTEVLERDLFIDGQKNTYLFYCLSGFVRLPLSDGAARHQPVLS